jgi:uncharacterized RDD family membrane protein YckC
VERDLDVRTAEAIAVRYELAGLGSRFLALCVDIAVQALVVLTLFIAFLLIAVITGGGSGRSVARAATGVEKEGTAILIAIAVIFGFVLFFGYFIVFELLWNGQSPGKRLLGLRVVRDAGFPIDAGASVIRNLVRVIETSLGFYFFSAIVMLISPENKRLGDFAAGTIVVRDSAAEAPALATLAPEESTADDGLDATDHALIDEFLARRASLDPTAAATIAARISARVRPRLRASFHYLDDVALLEHLARSRS